MALSNRAQEFQDYLKSLGHEFEVVELPASTRTAEEASLAVGTSVANIVKSLIFKNSETGEPVLILASGPNRVNEKKIGKLLGAKLEKADADFVRQMTGFAIGGVPPLGHKTTGALFVDEDLVKVEAIWAAAGTPHAVFCIPNPGKMLAETLPTHQVIDVK